MTPLHTCTPVDDQKSTNWRDAKLRARSELESQDNPKPAQNISKCALPISRAFAKRISQQRQTQAAQLSAAVWDDMEVGAGDRNCTTRNVDPAFVFDFYTCHRPNLHRLGTVHLPRFCQQRQFFNIKASKCTSHPMWCAGTRANNTKHFDIGRTTQEFTTQALNWVSLTSKYWTFASQYIFATHNTYLGVVFLMFPQ